MQNITSQKSLQTPFKNSIFARAKHSRVPTQTSDSFVISLALSWSYVGHKSIDSRLSHWFADSSTKLFVTDFQNSRLRNRNCKTIIFDKSRLPIWLSLESASVEMRASSRSFTPKTIFLLHPICGIKPSAFCTCGRLKTRSLPNPNL